VTSRTRYAQIEAVLVSGGDTTSGRRRSGRLACGRPGFDASSDATCDRRVLYSEGPFETAADRTSEQTAIEAAGLSIHQLALVRHGLGEPRVATASSASRSSDENAMTPAEREELRRRVKRLEQERDILKRDAAFVAREAATR
jgi:hypothetical protein